MIISIVVAVDERGGIGRENRLPWHLSDDLKYFRRLTMGHHVLMGRKTYQSSAGKMPGRKLIVLSRDPSFAAEDARVLPSFQEGVEFARSASETELFVIGGAQVFAEALPVAQRFYLTQVHADAGADVFFPKYDATQWKEITRNEFSTSPKNDHAFSTLQLERIN